MNNIFKLKGEEKKLENSSLIKSQYKRYLSSLEYDIWDAYKNPSHRKENAWKMCIQDCKNHTGHSLKIAGHNTSTFSAGFLFFDDDHREIYCHITPSHNRYLLIEQ